MKKRRTGGRGGRKPGRRLPAGTLLAALFLISSALSAFAQSGLVRRTWGGSLGGLSPTGEFRDRIDRVGIGIGLFYGWRIGNAPIFVGGEFTAQEIGHKLITTDADSYNSLLQGLAFVRLRPRTGSVVTYLEALAGLSYVTTETDYGLDEYGDAIIETDSDDIVLAAGFGGGVSFRLGRRGAETGRLGGGTYLDLKVRYMTGGRASYLVVLPDESLLPERSRTDFLTVQVGFSWFF